VLNAIPATAGSVSSSNLAALSTIPSTAGNITVPAVTGTMMVSGNMPTFAAYQGSSSQTISSASMTKVIFNSEEWDTANCFDSTTNYRFTPNVAGYYQINSSVSFTPAITPTGECQINIYKNGGFYRSGADISTGASSSIYALTISALVYANGTTDYFEIYVYQTSVGTKTVYGASSIQTYFQGCLLRNA
jgi:hypothetical protein